MVNSVNCKLVTASNKILTANDNFIKIIKGQKNDRIQNHYRTLTRNKI